MVMMPWLRLTRRYTALRPPLCQQTKRCPSRLYDLNRGIRPGFNRLPSRVLRRCTAVNHSTRSIRVGDSNIRDGTAASQEHSFRDRLTLRVSGSPPMGTRVLSLPYLQRLERNWLNRYRQASHSQSIA